MNYQTLYNEILNDPLSRGYAQMSDAEVAADLNTAYRTIDNPKAFATEREIAFAMAEAAEDPTAGEALLAKLEAAATSNAVVARNLAWVKPSEGGIPIGHPLVKATVSQLRTADVINDAERDVMLGLGGKTVSRAAELGLGNVNFRDVQRAKGRFA